MIRELEKALLVWKASLDRKPLILIGARQTGKSYIIKESLAPHFKGRVVVNFEESPRLKEAFLPDLNPFNIINRLSLLLNTEIAVGETLLFIDEVQVCPEAITSLRYFYEEMPKLHVIAAGSLIDFTLENISIPVGRVEYKYLYPLSFEEFIINLGHDKFLKQIASDFPGPFDSATHSVGLELLRLYCSLGGMPEVVNAYLNSKSLLTANIRKKQLIDTFIDDIPKYAKRKKEYNQTQFIFQSAPKHIARSFKFVDISREIPSYEVRASLNLLEKAKLIFYIKSTSGIPPVLFEKESRHKLLYLDIGLLQYVIGFDPSRWLTEAPQLLSGGMLAEQFVGQQLLSSSSNEEAQLYFWERTERGSSAEVDYLFSVRGKEGGETYVPIEVKTVSPGRLNSLRILLSKHPEIPFGVRLCAQNSSFAERLISLPLYALPEFMKRARETGLESIDFNRNIAR